MEEKKLKVLLLSTFIVGVFSFYLASFYDLRLLFYDLTASYRAVLNIDRDITLSESYIFNVKKSNKYRMLFRYWKVPLTVDENLNKPFIKIKDIYGDSKIYIKDFKGRIYGKKLSKQEALFVLQKAYYNETGLIKTDYFPAGKYSLNALYHIFPPVQTDNYFSHLNLKLADKHIPYEKIQVTIKDPLGLIVEIFPHIPEYRLEKRKNKWEIIGKAKRDGLVEIEILTRKFDFNGFPVFVKDVFRKTYKANKNIKRQILLTGKYLLSGTVLLFPFVLWLFYQRFGKEKEFTVPRFLSFIPDRKRKPYVVNLIFNGDATEGDENGFYATLLDLQRKGKIKITPYKSDLEIKITDPVVEDPYEKKVIHFLQSYTIDPERKVFSTAEIRRKIESYYTFKDESMLRMIKNHMDNILKYRDETLSDQFVDRTGKLIFLSVSIPLIILGGIFLILFIFDLFFGGNLFPEIDLYPHFILSAGLYIQFLLVFLTPTQFLGRWKGEAYKEKLQWEAFKNFLSDLAMIKKYAPEDISIWKEWLIYATALGVADKVEKAMESLNIKIPEIETDRALRFRFSTTYGLARKRLSSLQTSKSSGMGGGGFGSGGGFGGGGAGGR